MKTALTLLSLVILLGCNIYDDMGNPSRVKPEDKRTYTDSLGRDIKEYGYYCESLDTFVYNRVVKQTDTMWDGSTISEKYKEFFDPTLGYHTTYKSKVITKYPKILRVGDTMFMISQFRKLKETYKNENLKYVRTRYIRSFADLMDYRTKDLYLGSGRVDHDADGVLDHFDREPVTVGYYDSANYVDERLLDYVPTGGGKKNNKQSVSEQPKVNYIKGKMAYGVPDTMIVGKSYDVTLIITKEMTKERENIMIQQIDNNSRTVSKISINDIRVGSVMIAELIDGSGNFEITPTSTAEQNIEDFDQTEWRWVVKPLKSGNNPLRLVVKVRVYTDEGSYLKDIPVFDKDIYVQSNIKYTAGNWLSENWEWFMSTLVIPIFLYFWNKRKKKGEEDPKDK